MRPFLKLYLIHSSSISNTEYRYRVYFELKYKLTKFQEYNPAFGRKVFVKKPQQPFSRERPKFIPSHNSDYIAFNKIIIDENTDLFDNKDEDTIVDSSDDDSTLSEILTPTNLQPYFTFIARINDMGTDTDIGSDDDEICDNFDNNMITDSSKIKSTKTKIVKLQSSSKKIVEKNMKVMKYFTNEFDSGNEILISPYRCYHCHHNFNNKPFFLPIDYNCELNRFKVTGNFCSPNCVKTYALNSKIYQNRIYLIGHMYRKLFGPNYTIKPAPPIQTLKEYGGKLSIEEFRANFDNSKQYSVKNIFCKVLMDEVIEK